MADALRSGEAGAGLRRRARVESSKLPRFVRKVFYKLSSLTKGPDPIFLFRPAGKMRLATFCGNRFLSDGLFLVLMTSIASLGLMEFYNLVQKRGLVCFTGWGIVSGLLLMVSTFTYLSGDLVPPASPSRANDFESSILII